MSVKTSVKSSEGFRKEFGKKQNRWSENKRIYLKGKGKYLKFREDRLQKLKPVIPTVYHHNQNYLNYKNQTVTLYKKMTSCFIVYKGFEK